MTGDLSLGDNVKAKFGTGDDLQIYHDGSNSFIKDTGTGDLRIQGNNVVIRDSTTAISAEFVTGGSAKLRYNNSEKLATTSTGVDVTGTVTADGLTVEGAIEITGNSPALALKELDTTDSDVFLRLNGGNFNIETRSDAGAKLGNRITADSNGDVKFYEDTGTTAKFHWDSSAERLGIGTSPAEALHVYSAISNINALIESGDANAYLAFKDNATTNSASVFLGASGDNMTFHAGGASERMRIDSSGKVGIGTASPSVPLDVHGGTIGVTSSTAFAGLQITSANNSFAYVNFGDSDDGNIGQIQYDHSSNAMITKTKNAERARVDSSGNLLVGKTSADFGATAGFEARPDGRIATGRAGESAVFNRLSTDGDIALFRKDGSTVGSIGTYGGYPTIGSSVAGFLFNGSGSNQIVPWNVGANSSSDGLTNLGAGTNRFKDLYLSGGVYLGGTGADHKLDDYEEGNWTPVVGRASGFTASGATAGTSKYTKIGRQVTLEFELTMPDSSGSITVGDDLNLTAGCLPFTPIDNGHAVGTIGVQSGMITASDIAMGYAGFSGVNTLGLIIHAVDGTVNRSSILGGVITYFTND